jgi:hypothetical protein
LDAKQFAALMDKMDKVLRLQAIETVKDLTNEREKVELLSSMGFSVTDIDRFLGKSPGYSSTVLYQLRKKKQPKQEQGPEQTAVTTPEITA